MKTIFKYQFNISVSFSLKMPQGAKILSAEVQNEIPCIWAEVNPEAKVEKRNFSIVGTGQEIPAESWHIRSFQDDSFVWHLYEVR